ncbi:hypothetical protein [Burkholderia sp. MBR-1]|uniref:hypothetical protein n=1 Tax=Burkholderia sp. MBR-1 TaxID=2732364 RepID=UPI0015EEF1AF|nr:hypothetical protein [Burkholderia sp. MBR-1]QMI49910.1 hypothetical protein MBR110_31110 [Burkholderia sp. MBR-1]
MTTKTDTSTTCGFAIADAKVASQASSDADPNAPDLRSEDDTIVQRIAAACSAGVVLDECDQLQIRETLRKAKAFRRKADRVASLGADPMNKGNAFPMGVGFTRVTKRAAQRIDASVRRAGEAVDLYRKAEQFEAHANTLLSGKGTAADRQRCADARVRTQREALARLIGWKKGDTMGRFCIERVNRDRDGYPVSYTISGEGIVKGVWDKVDVIRTLFDGDKSAFRRTVDEIREALAETQ